MTITREQVAKVLAVEFLFYPSVQITPALSAAWHSHFADCEPEEFAAGMRAAIQNQNDKWPPVPSQVRAIIQAARKGPEELETPEEAWAAAMAGKNMSRKARRAALLMDGYEKRGQWLIESMPFKKREFIEIYKNLENKDRRVAVRDQALTIGERSALKLIEQARR